MILKTATLIVAALAATASTCWGFGFTFGANPYTEGPYYSYNPPDVRQTCVWQRQRVVDKNGHRVLKRIRICH